MIRKPKVTVLIPVYNSERYIKESVESILSQTFQDFEILLIDDGSMDGSLKIINSFKDSRIRIVKNRRNKGLVKTLNRGISLSRGEYIARMDADDISFANRLSLQVEFMDAHADVGVCGTWFETIGLEHNYVLRNPVDDTHIKVGQLFSCKLAHPSVIIRKAIINKYKLRYDERYVESEDYDYWERVGRHCKLANLPIVLLYYRVHLGQKNQINRPGVDKFNTLVQKRQLFKLGLRPSEADLKTHFVYSRGRIKKDIIQLIDIFSWNVKLVFSNHNKRYFPVIEFDLYIINKFIMYFFSYIGILCKN